MPNAYTFAHGTLRFRLSKRGWTFANLGESQVHMRLDNPHRNPFAKGAYYEGIFQIWRARR